ncbi:hypothetical protein BDQ17DRAFT_1351334 [Cyathus striatus]|nr:hypothetical protein BDQ17DRAFT_1351334 [Cyathus striatus]
MKFSLASVLALFAVPALVSAVVVPGADTPTFYLVAASSNPDANLKPLRTQGGSGGYATLSGTGSIGEFYFYHGTLTGAPRVSSSSATLLPLIGFNPMSTGCSTYGQLGFTEGSSTNKCARYSPFGIQSDSENAQLGASLTFNYAGGFYVCGSGLDVWYKVSPGDGPSGCTPITLSTVPVV